jgi:site-specific DNA-methyltransferase (adenine-specific)
MKIEENLNTIIHGNCLEVMERMPSESFDMIFADPPYFLSNGGITCKNGEAVSVNKGKWDESMGLEKNHEFNLLWLKECQRLLKKDGTIWVSGTHHVIFSIGFAMQQLGFKILNDIAWEKPNPPPNLSCRYFTHSTETIIWAAKNNKSKHLFNYDKMRVVNNGKQMKTVWSILPPKTEEKAQGKHPTQKPTELITRCILASTNEGDLIFDPFAGSSTTGVCAIKTNRNFICIEQDAEYVALGKKRLDWITNNILI